MPRRRGGRAQRPVFRRRGAVRDAGGARPFTGRTSAEIAYRLVHEQSPDLAAIAPGVSPALASVVQRALAKRPADRFNSAAAMSEALRASSAPSGATEAEATVVMRPTARPRRACDSARDARDRYDFAGGGCHRAGRGSAGGEGAGPVPGADCESAGQARTATCRIVGGFVGGAGSRDSEWGRSGSVPAAAQSRLKRRRQGCSGDPDPAMRSAPLLLRPPRTKLPKNTHLTRGRLLRSARDDAPRRAPSVRCVARTRRTRSARLSIGRLSI